MRGQSSRQTIFVAWIVIITAVVSSLCVPNSAEALPLTPDSLLLINSGESKYLWEYSTDGVQIQQIELPSNLQPRALAVDKNKKIQIFNGTFNPTLVTYDPYSESITHTSFPGWSVANNTRYGSMAAFGDYIFVNDMSTAYDGAPQGIIRFNVDTMVGERFATNTNPFELNVGLDGRLYTLSGYNDVRVYDPNTLEFVEYLNLSGVLRTIAADEHGNVYANNSDNQLVMFDSSGAYQATFPLKGTSSLDILPDGSMLGGDQNAKLHYSPDMSFGSVIDIYHPLPHSIKYGSAAFNVTPVGVVPEPSTYAMATLGLLGLGLLGWRQRRGTKVAAARDC